MTEIFILMNYNDDNLQITDYPNSEVNTQSPYNTKFHCVFDWKLCDSSIMFASCVQGVHSNTEITSDTDPCSIQIARIKLKSKGQNEKQYALYQTPFWWCQSYLLGNADIQVVNVDDDDNVESINTISLDAILRDHEVFVCFFQCV